MRAMRSLATLLEGYRRLAVWVFGLILLLAFLESFSLGLLLPMIEMATHSDKPSSISRFIGPLLDWAPANYRLSAVAGLTLTLVLLKSVVRVVLTRYQAKLRAGISTHLVNAVLSNYLLYDFKIALQKKHGELLGVVFGETNRAAQAINDLVELVSKLFLSAAILAILVATSWQLTLVSIVVLGGGAILGHFYSNRRAVWLGERSVEVSRHLYSDASEVLSGLRQIKTFGLEVSSLSSVRQRLRELVRIAMEVDVLAILPMPIGELLVALFIASLIFYTEWTRALTIAELLPALSLSVVAMRPLAVHLSTISKLRIGIGTYLPSVELVGKVIQEKHVLEVLDQGLPLSKLESDVVLSGIQFAYPGKAPLFENLSLTLRKGRVTAIVGPSGIGKSSLLDLMLGLQKPTRGELLINGRPLSAYKLSAWRQLVGFVSQDTFLFNASIAENIAVSLPGAKLATVQRAAKLANADSFISLLPEGYATLVGERGTSLSGGQRQRLAIARALLREPELLILDEATSALDSATEEEITRAIRSVAKERTVLIISHRPSLISLADEVYEMGPGGALTLSTHERAERKLSQVGEAKLDH